MASRRPDAASRRYLEGMEYLVSVVQQISLARSLDAQPGRGATFFWTLAEGESPPGDST